MALILGLFTVAVFWPAVKNGFVNFDDPDYVVQNANVQNGLTWPGLAWAFTSGHACNWHPLTWISHMLDCQWFGLQPWGHHLTSVLIHGLSTALLFLVLRRLTGTFWRALLVAAIFGLHPTRVESVAWVSERKDVLCAFFWIATMGAYDRWTTATQMNLPNRMRWYAIMLGLYTLGLLSKPMIVTLPCVLLLLDFWPARRFPQGHFFSLLGEKLPFFLLTMISSAITIMVQQRTISTLETIPLQSRFLNAIVSYSRYLGQLFWPADLAAFYPRPDHWAWTTWIPATVLLLAISAVAWRQREKSPYLLVGWLWYLGTAVPVIGLVQVGSQAMADRYTYIPSIGLLIIVAWGTAELAQHFKLPRTGLAFGAATAMAACLTLTFQQIAFWKDDVTLFSRAVAVTPPAFLPYTNLAAALFAKGQYRASVPFFIEALRLFPDDAFAHCNYGMVLLELGETNEAIAEFDRSKALSAKAPIPHARLGVILLQAGRVDEALPHFVDAIQFDPPDAQTSYSYAEGLKKKGRLEESLTQYREAMRLKPQVPDAYLGMAELLGVLNRKGEAMEMWQQALKLAPDHAKAHNNLGVLLGEAGRLQEAEAHFQTAVRLDPSDPDAAFNLRLASVALAKQRTPQ